MNNDQVSLNLAPALIVIFGITGDLSKRKLLPALYSLINNNLLHPKTQIVGITRQSYTKQELLEIATPGIKQAHKKIDQIIANKLLRRTTIYKMSAASSEDYPGLAGYLDTLEDKSGICLGRIYYLAVPPQISAPIINNLGANNMQIGCRKHGAKAHLLLEKPFGFDTNTAKELVDVTTKYFSEKQIFRIDHYLAKETVQNIISFRFRNPIFENIWNNHHIKSIEIVSDEKIDIEGRGNFYEQVGALRDVVQNHLLHILSIIIMDKPNDILSSNDIHNSRLKALKSIEIVPSELLPERAWRGQYIGYRKEVNIPASFVETFACVLLYSNNPLWRDVPIRIRTGKALSQKLTQITICFSPKQLEHDYANKLIFDIQPNEGIVLQLWAKKPGFQRELREVLMSFSYEKSFVGNQAPDAYERVLVDAIRGDSTLFATSEELLAAWQILQPVIDKWSLDDQGLLFYSKSTPGDDIIENYNY